jgi:hypothetical protein
VLKAKEMHVLVNVSEILIVNVKKSVKMRRVFGDLGSGPMVEVWELLW